MVKLQPLMDVNTAKANEHDNKNLYTVLITIGIYKTVLRSGKYNLWRLLQISISIVRLCVLL